MATARITRSQVRMIRRLVHGPLGWDDEAYHDFLADRGGPASTLSLGRAEAANLIDILLDLAAGRSPRVWRLSGATVLQRQTAESLAGVVGLEDPGGVIHRVTRGRCNRLDQCSIHEARAVIEALRSIAARHARQAAAR